MPLSNVKANELEFRAKTSRNPGEAIVINLINDRYTIYLSHYCISLEDDGLTL